MDSKLLEPLDLNGSELALYQAILKAGGLSPASLAKAAGLKRTTAYSVARSLIEKGLLIEDATKRPRVFAPASAEQVLALIERDKKHITEREDAFQKLAAELSKLSAQTSYPVPTVRFIEENKLNDFLHSQAAIWDQSAIDEKEPTWWGFQDHTLVEHYGKWIEWYWERWDERVNLNLLSNRAPVEVEFATRNARFAGRRNIKFWGEATDFLSTTWIVGDYLIMVNTRTKPFYLVEIHDKLMAHDQREVFRNLWPLV